MSRESVELALSEPLSPTPFADVNAVLEHFLTRSQAILGSQFKGMYLVGSLALGDFDPTSSDIDWVIVTGAQIADEQFEGLQGIHAQFAASSSPMKEKIEVIYIPTHVLRYGASDDSTFPQIEKGTQLFKASLDSSWVFQCVTLRDYGLVVTGPEPKTLVRPIRAQELSTAAARITGLWLEQARADPTWLPWLRRRKAQTFVILTLCRLLYSMATGSVTSKPRAAEWAQKDLGDPWAALIERTLANQHEGRTITQSEEQETLSFIQFTFEQSK